MRNVLKRCALMIAVLAVACGRDDTPTPTPTPTPLPHVVSWSPPPGAFLASGEPIEVEFAATLDAESYSRVHAEVRGDDGALLAHVPSLSPDGTTLRLALAEDAELSDTILVALSSDDATWYAEETWTRAPLTVTVTTESLDGFRHYADQCGIVHGTVRVHVNVTGGSWSRIVLDHRWRAADSLTRTTDTLAVLPRGVTAYDWDTRGANGVHYQGLLWRGGWQSPACEAPFDELLATVYRGSAAFWSWRYATVDNVGPTLLACGASSYDPKLECDFSASGGPKHCALLFSEPLLSEAIGTPPATPEPNVHFLDSAGRRIEAMRAAFRGINWHQELRLVMNVEPASDIAPGPAKVVVEQAVDLAGNVSLPQSCDINIRP